MSSGSDKIYSYLSSLGARPVYSVPEESAIDSKVGVEVSTSKVQPLHVFDLDLESYVNVHDGLRWKYFVDGVKRSILFEVTIDSIRVPFVLSHIIVGATRLRGSKLHPYKFYEAKVLIAPFSALRMYASANNIDFDLPQLPFLDYRGQILDKVQSNHEFLSDTTLSLEDPPRRKVELVDLHAPGKLRGFASSRSLAIMRILELGVIWDIIKDGVEGFVLLDGPLLLILKYSRLVTDELMGLQDVTNRTLAYDVLSKVVSAVKTIEVIPGGAIETVTTSPPNVLRIPIYKTSDFVNDRMASYFLSAFIWLRRELSQQLSTIISPTSGIIRLDIPFPAIVDMNEKWFERDYKLDILSTLKYKKLTQIICEAIRNRWPVPPLVDYHRLLVEYYHIRETEYWLRSKLTPVPQLLGY